MAAPDAPVDLDDVVALDARAVLASKIGSSALSSYSREAIDRAGVHPRRTQIEVSDRKPGFQRESVRVRPRAKGRGALALAPPDNDQRRHANIPCEEKALLRTRGHDRVQLRR